jgi:hypothetical protein
LSWNWAWLAAILLVAALRCLKKKVMRRISAGSFVTKAHFGRFIHHYRGVWFFFSAHGGVEKDGLVMLGCDVSDMR